MINYLKTDKDDVYFNHLYNNDMAYHNKKILFNFFMKLKINFKEILKEIS